MSEVPLQEVEHDRLAIHGSDPQHEWPLEGCDSSRVEAPYTRGTSLGEVPREQKMLKGHLPRVM